jgi:hypothetical protein
MFASSATILNAVKNFAYYNIPDLHLEGPALLHQHSLQSVAPGCHTLQQQYTSIRQEKTMCISFSNYKENVHRVPY